MPVQYGAPVWQYLSDNIERKMKSIFTGEHYNSMLNDRGTLKDRRDILRNKYFRDVT